MVDKEDWVKIKKEEEVKLKLAAEQAQAQGGQALSDFEHLFGAPLSKPTKAATKVGLVIL